MKSRISVGNTQECQKKSTVHKYFKKHTFSPLGPSSPLSPLRPFFPLRMTQNQIQNLISFSRPALFVNDRGGKRPMSWSEMWIWLTVDAIIGHEVSCSQSQGSLSWAAPGQPVSNVFHQKLLVCDWEANERNYASLSVLSVRIWRMSLRGKHLVNGHAAAFLKHDYLSSFWKSWHYVSVYYPTRWGGWVEVCMEEKKVWVGAIIFPLVRHTAGYLTMAVGLYMRFMVESRVL